MHSARCRCDTIPLMVRSNDAPLRPHFGCWCGRPEVPCSHGEPSSVEVRAMRILVMSGGGREFWNAEGFEVGEDGTLTGRAVYASGFDPDAEIARIAFSNESGLPFTATVRDGDVDEVIDLPEGHPGWALVGLSPEQAVQHMLAYPDGEVPLN